MRLPFNEKTKAVEDEGRSVGKIAIEHEIVPADSSVLTTLLAEDTFEEGVVKVEVLALAKGSA